jgi:hypothetical protein
MLAPAPVAAQAPARSAFVPLVADSIGSVSALATPVTLSFTDVALGDVISAVAKQAGMSLTYDSSLPGIDRKISITLTRIAANRAILQLLEHVPIQAMVSSTGQIVLVARSAGRRTGVVEGMVRDAITAGPVAGAHVELEGTRFATMSRDDGAFSLG